MGGCDRITQSNRALSCRCLGSTLTPDLKASTSLGGNSLSRCSSCCQSSAVSGELACKVVGMVLPGCNGSTECALPIASFRQSLKQLILLVYSLLEADSRRVG